jgi:hypothetical protein
LRPRAKAWVVQRRNTDDEHPEDHDPDSFDVEKHPSMTVVVGQNVRIQVAAESVKPAGRA